MIQVHLEPEHWHGMLSTALLPTHTWNGPQGTCLKHVKSCKIQLSTWAWTAWHRLLLSVIPRARSEEMKCRFNGLSRNVEQRWSAGALDYKKKGLILQMVSAIDHPHLAQSSNSSWSLCTYEIYKWLALLVPYHIHVRLKYRFMARFLQATTSRIGISRFDQCDCWGNH